MTSTTTTVFAVAVLYFISGAVCYENLTCTLLPTSETSERFNDTINEKVKFIYLKLNFIDTEFNNTEFAYLNNTKDVIDPLTWVLAIAGNGELLLQCPFDFRYISLGTLTASGVTTVDIDIIDPDECFKSDISDEEKLLAVVDLLSRLTTDAIDFFQDKKGEELIQLQDVQICLERQSTERRYIFRNKKDRTENLLQRLSQSAHGVLQSTEEYQCWNVVNNSDSTVVPRDRAYWWVRWLLNTVVTVFILFSPHVLFRIFDWKNPPKNDQVRIDTQPYPFGFFHFVFYSTFVRSRCALDICSLSCWFRHIMFFFFMTFLCCVQFIPYSYVDSHNYALRKMAAERMGVWRFDWANRTATFFCVVVIFLNITMFNILKFYIMRRDKNGDKNRDQERDGMHDIGKTYLTMVIFPQREDGDIIREMCYQKCENVFEDTPNIWNVRFVLKKIYTGNRTRFTQILLTPIILGYWIGQLVPLIYYTNVVLAVVIALIHNKLTKEKRNTRKDRENPPTRRGSNLINEMTNLPDHEDSERKQYRKQTYVDVICMYLWLVPWFCLVFIFVTSFVFFQIFVACSHLIEVVAYTLVGIIVNAKSVVAWLVLAIGVASFLIQTVTGYSNSYVSLFYDIFEISDSLTSKIGHSIVSHDVDGVPQINLDFFRHIAYKMKPWKPTLFFIYVQLLSAGIFFLLGFLLLKYVDGLNDLRGQSELLGAFVIGGLLPIAKLLTSSPATAKCKEKARRCKIEALILSRASVRGGSVKEENDEENDQSVQSERRYGQQEKEGRNGVDLDISAPERPHLATYGSTRECMVNDTR